MLKKTANLFFFILIICKINAQNVQVAFSFPNKNHFCANSGVIVLPQGSPIGGTYIGIGVTENTFDTNLYPGTYEIKYQYTLPENGIVITASDKLSLQMCVSLNNTENLNNINVYPNETTNLWIVENALGLNYEVLTSLGVIIHSGKLISTKQVIDLHNVPRNMYCFCIKDKNGVLLKWKNICVN